MSIAISSLEVGFLFFVRGGYVDPGNQLFFIAGYEGDYWSAWASSSTSDAYRLYFYNSGVNPSHGSSSRYYGRSLRCLIPTTQS